MSKPVCPEHNMEARLTPAGVSKKPPYRAYGAFWSCQIRGCGWTQNAEAPQPAQEARSAPVVVSESNHASPRLQAAIAALQAASYGPGSPAEVMDRAATYYHEFLKPAFLSDVPVPVTPKVVP